MHTEPAVEHGHLVLQRRHVRPPVIGAHPARATGVVTPGFVLDPLPKVRGVVGARLAGLNLRIGRTGHERGVDLAHEGDTLRQRVDVLLPPTRPFREGAEVDLRLLVG